MSIHISIFYLRPCIISHNSQYKYIIGILKHTFGLKLRLQIGKNRLRLVINFGRLTYFNEKFTSIPIIIARDAQLLLSN
jgi:hypothetical protein